MKALPPTGASDRARDTAVNQLIQGRSNAVGTMTLGPGTATTVSKSTISIEAQVFLFPKTASAAAEMTAGALHISDVSNGAFTVRHGAGGPADRVFAFLVLGG